MSRYIMALDQGTTSSRAILFDRAGAVCGVDQYEFSQHFPQPGWVEHDANEIWDSQLRAARGALEAAGASASDIAAVGGEREGVIRTATLELYHVAQILRNTFRGKRGRLES